MRTGAVIFGAVVVAGSGLIFYLNQRPAAVVPAAGPQYTSTSSPPTFTFVPARPAATALPTETPLPTATIVTTPTPGLGAMISGRDGMSMVYVPEGEFTMGSDMNPDEQPIHQVALDAYWIDQTEVTNAMYRGCVAANQCRPLNHISSNSRDSYFYDPNFSNYPVVHVSWNDASDYCAWAGRRLPTEAEWEKAARGAHGNLYPWGNEDPNSTLINLDLIDTTAAGQYPAGASFYCAFDMAGNVWEWVSDRYGESYYTDSPSSNPTGPEEGAFRVLRGGSWFHLDGSDRSSERYHNSDRFNSNKIGFRCAVTP